MKLILLSGGSGKRLWPMSNDSRSKQFLRVLDDGHGNMVSMLQRVWSQLEHNGLQSNTYICASKAQREIIESQIGICPFIEEPARRDTFPAIALAVTYLADVDQCADDEVVAVVPIDPMVDDSYFESIGRLENVLLQSQSDLALMGVRPNEASDKFGYVRVREGEIDRDWLEVDSFIEKPHKEIAEQLIAGGALWNCGVFCFRIGYIKQFLITQGYSASYHDLLQQFESLPKNSFDYEVVENAERISILPYAGQWKDLGSWETLSTEFASDFVGLGNIEGCEETHVINELGIPLVAMGLRNSIVVATPDGILVSAKKDSGGIKSIVNEYGDRPMFEERRWGTYRVLDYQKSVDGIEVLTKFVQISAGRNISYQKHLLRSEVWTIVEGHGEIVLDTRIMPVQAGDVVRIHTGQWHAICANDNLSFIEVQRGTELIEEDIIRRCLTWSEIVSLCQVLA
ncbi:sugar phosphate nucleotidyltransferase [Alicyclobacillus fastidiosus]|uniref:Sugar phosphate nucleotidyltransferase n=1 Tax=Alicyclobacillus fastidiosus TaxID=392011 RepID=A0ABY6ZLW5_9BACL|nr:sugar phosphate nucleotidyltransferase [Alicyclobacillus fastidiosus]WAH43121.1 sugar phosphate nucleotidyltransferase [Alicyclobacillus fastidiosus]GMA65126.1 mannose-1-phosphate guanylyltransferase [Alicyclobacillus fastidiosus]